MWHFQTIANHNFGSSNRIEAFAFNAFGMRMALRSAIALAVLFVTIFVAAHALARVSNISSAQILVARFYTDDYWWHPTDRAFAKTLLMQATQNGDVSAQYRMARDYETEKNYAQAIYWHKDLADKGWSESQLRLGLLYMDGHGVNQNTTEAIKWLKSAATQGDTNSHLMLGLIYFGELPNSQPDIPQAVQWVHSSAQMGNGQAQDTLARLYAAGKGVPKNFDIALEWAKRSVDSGYANADETVQLIQTLKGDKNGR